MFGLMACHVGKTCYQDNVKEKKQTDLATEILGARSEDDILQCLKKSDITQEEQLTIVVRLLALTLVDKDRIKERLASVLASRFGHSSEKASEQQLALFAEALRTLAQGTGVAPSNPPTEPSAKAADETGAQEGGATTQEESTRETSVVEAEPAAALPPDLHAITQQTEREIKALVDQKRAAAQAERERRRQAMKEPGADAVPRPPPWPDNLPVREVYCPVHNRACTDPECGRDRNTLRFDTSWRIEEKVSYEVVVYHREVVACSHGHGAPESAPGVPNIVPRGHLGLALSVRILWLRFSQNLPVCRIVEILAADQISVSEEQIHTMFEHAVGLLAPVLLALQVMVRASSLINLDDTTARIMDRRLKRRCRIARMWLALGDERWAWYFATADWKADGAKDKLGAVSGVVQGDGYRGHKRNANVLGWLMAGCMAHLRRKLLRAVVAKDPRATEAMALVQALYRVERLAKEAGLNAAGRLKLRLERSVPLMEALAAWARRVAPTIEQGSPLGQAWTYLDNQWDALCTYLTSGHVSIDNNAAERGLRRFAIGRKLWLFFRGDHTCERAAVIASVLMTARLHGANELQYLRWLFEQLLRREWSETAARALLPDFWLAAQQEEAKESGRVSPECVAR